jgi:thiamine kinase-like enzyme
MSRHPSINLESIRTRLDLDWHELNDKEVLASLVRLEALWQSEGRSWHAWRPMSIRLCWRWLKLGLGRRWLSLHADLNDTVSSWIDEESAIAATEERAVSFGYCHGDSDPAHLRLDASGKMVLIDCERLHPGYFGHDWADLVLRGLNNATDDTVANRILEQALAATASSSLCPEWLLLSWLKWITVMRLCRAHALIERKAVEYGLARLRRIERISTR